MMKPSYNPTRRQIKQVGGKSDGTNMIYALSLQVSQLPDVEAEIRRLISLPAQVRTFGDDFEKRYNRGQKMHCMLKPGSRFARLQKMVRMLKEVMDQQFKSTESDVQLGLYAQALLSHVGQSDFSQLLTVKEGMAFEQKAAAEHHERFNSLLSKLEKKCKSPEFIRKVKAEKTEVEKRRSSLQSWFRAVIRSQPRVFWIQIQLGYENPVDSGNAATTIQHRAAFLKDRRKATEFKHMLGYVCKLSYLPRRGHIHDLVVLYDAANVFESESLAIALGNLWHRVTIGAGVAFTEGGCLEGTVSPVNGLVSMSSADDRKKVKDVVEYFSQFDTFIHYHATDKSKTLVKSQAPGTRKKKNAVPTTASP